VFSRNKTADSTSGTSKNGLGLQQLQGKNQSTNSDDQRDSSNSSGGRRSKGFLSFGISKGSKIKTSNATQPDKGFQGFHLKSAMRQEQSRHRGSNAGNVSPDITEESSYYSGGSEGSWETEASFEAGNDCGFLCDFGDDDDESCADDEREMNSMTTPVPIKPPKGSKRKKSEKGKTTESPVGYPAQLKNVFGLAASDTPDEISYSSGTEGGSLDEADGRGAIVTDGLGDPDNETTVDQMTLASSAPIGMPSVSDISAWLFAADYDKSQSDLLAKKNEEIDKVDRTAELNMHQGQLDIYARSPESLSLRLYPNAPRRPDRSNHVLVKVEASTVSIQDYLERSSGEQEVPGRQIVGEVIRVGRTARKRSMIQVGDRIVALTPNGMGNARFISIPSSSAIPISPDIQCGDALCLVESYMSAYQMLNLGRTNGIPYTDAKVLIIGGSDPVGQALVELALKEGANVVATAEKSHREYLEKMGAIWLPNKPKKFAKLSGKMDVVIDTLCLDGYKSSYEALNYDGKLVCTINPPLRDHGSIFDRMGRSWSRFTSPLFPEVSFYDVNKSFQNDPRMFEHEFRYLLVKLRNKEINPKISGRVALNQVPKAQNLVKKGLPNGTIIVLPWEKLDSTQHVPVDNVR